MSNLFHFNDEQSEQRWSLYLIVSTFPMIMFILSGFGKEPEVQSGPFVKSFHKSSKLPGIVTRKLCSELLIIIVKYGRSVSHWPFLYQVLLRYLHYIKSVLDVGLAILTGVWCLKICLFGCTWFNPGHGWLHRGQYFPGTHSACALYQITVVYGGRHFDRCLVLPEMFVWLHLI